MKRILQQGAALSIMIILSACGGGSGSGMVTTPPPVGNPGPTPGPAPAVYSKFADLTGDQNFENASAEQKRVIDINFQTSRTFTLSDFGSGITFTYDADSDSYILTQADGFTSTFGPSALRPSSTDALKSFEQPKEPTDPNSNRESLQLSAPLVNGVALSYTRLGIWLGYNQTESVAPLISTTNRFVAGVPTIASDMPTSGTAAYSTVVDSGFVRSASNAYNITDSTATFSANFLNGSINTLLSLNAVSGLAGSTAFPLGTVSGMGTVNSGSSSFNGTFASGGIFTNGQFSGSFFGPAALEFGYVYLINGNGDVNGTVEKFSIYGTVAGAKGP